MSPLDQDFPDEKEMGFLDHLEEVRKRLFYAAIAIVSGGLSCLFRKTGSSIRCCLDRGMRIL
jgi:Sec-independent protein secretion pathway component TatC